MSTINPDTVNETSSSSVFYVAQESDTVQQREGIKAIYCTTAGNLDVSDWEAAPNRVTIAMIAGQILPIRPQFIHTASTGAYLCLAG